MDEFIAAETQAAISNLLTAVEVVAVDAATARVQVSDGELTTDWLPWFTPRWGNVQVWSPPSVGEGCLLLAAGGDWGQGMVLPALAEAAGLATTQHLVRFSDGTQLAYDTTTKALTANTTGPMSLSAPTVTITGNLTVTGNLTAAQVQDGTGTLAALRGAYNAHNHSANGTSPPSPTV
jgi:phage baseplate assembly protein V